MESDLSKPYSIVKNTCPAPAGVLPRERLYDLIRYDRGCPVKWIQGPPGSGKTTVVADYIVSSEINHIWYSIDETDVALPVFFQCLASAVTKNVNQKITDFPELTKDQIFNLAIFSRKYFQKIYSAISFPFTLVFDNYQRLLPDSDLHEIMCIGIEEAPPGVSIIFISRKLLPSTFRRLQANSYIEVIAWRDLSLTKDEFNEIIGMKGYAETFSDQILDSLYEQIQGWLAGLVLFLSNLNVKGPVSEDITNIVIEAVYDYFTAEILNHIEEAQRLFLYKSAFLIQPTSAMAKELTGVADAEDILSYFYSNHWFIEKQGQSEPEYHFHPLFRKFLIVQACRFYSKTELLHIKEKAAEILLNASYLDHAIEYIVGISDWQWFKELTIENAHLLIAHGKNLTLIKWMNQLPENILHGNSWLLYWLGVSEIVINPQKSQDYFEIAFSLFRKAKDRTGLFLAWSGIIKANIYKFESGDSFKKWIPVGNDLIEEYPDFPSVDIEVDMLISLLMGSILLGTNRGEIEKRSTRILELSNQISDEWIRKNGIIVMSFYYTINGYIHRSETFLASIRDGDKLENEPLVNQVVGSHLEILNLFYAAKNERCIELAIKQSRLLGLDHLHFWKVPLLGHAAAAALSEENVKDANTYLGKMNSQLKTGLNIDTFFYQILKAWSLLLDDLFLALHLAQNALKLAYGLEFSILIHTALIAVSQIFHELGQFDDAVKTLQKAYQVAEDIQNPLALCQCEITHSYFSLEQDNVSELTKILKKAMGTGRKQDAVNFIFWRRSVMSSICAKALELEIEVEYVKRLIKKRCLMIDASSQNVENWPWKVKIVTLGRFEIIVDDIPIAFTGKVQKTPLAVLKILISLLMQSKRFTPRVTALTSRFSFFTISIVDRISLSSNIWFSCVKF